jgi:hypothetical protein
MKAIFTAALVSCAAFAAVAEAQAPCSTKAAVLDSARDDAHNVLTSGNPLVEELRQEQRMTRREDVATMTAVNERYVCARIAGTFNHMVPPGVTFAVLRIGPIYYARDPDQRRATGVITDSTFKVLMRLGVSSETVAKSKP